MPREAAPVIEPARPGKVWIAAALFLGSILGITASLRAQPDSPLAAESMLTLKDVELQEKEAPAGWKLSPSHQKLVQHPNDLYLDPSLEGLAPAATGKRLFSFTTGKEGVTSVYLLVYPGPSAVEEALPLIMGYLWGLAMAPSPERPAKLLRCQNVLAIVAGMAPEEVTAWVNGQFRQRCQCTQMQGAPIEAP